MMQFVWITALTAILAITWERQALGICTVNFTDQRTLKRIVVRSMEVAGLLLPII